MKFNAAIALVAALFASLTNTVLTFAAEQTVEDLYNDCTEKRTYADQGFCMGFVSGVARQTFINGSALKKFQKDDSTLGLIMAPISACGDSFVSNAATVQVFINWAKDHPDRWNQPAGLGVMQAIRDTWPCPK
jgi:hypothetical protein